MKKFLFRPWIGLFFSILIFSSACISNKAHLSFERSGDSPEILQPTTPITTITSGQSGVLSSQSLTAYVRMSPTGLGGTYTSEQYSLSNPIQKAGESGAQAGMSVKSEGAR